MENCGHVGQDGTRLGARNQLSIVPVSAIDKCFLPNQHSGLSGNSCDTPSGASEDYFFWPETFHGVDVASRQPVTCFCLMVERSVKFDVMQSNALLLCDSFQCAHLLDED